MARLAPALHTGVLHRALEQPSSTSFPVPNAASQRQILPGASFALCGLLPLLSAVRATEVRGQQQLRTGGRATVLQARRAEVELLVDADQHSIQEIRAGIDMLRCMENDYSSIRTTIFAAPRRRENKAWQRLFSEPGIHFRPVKRRRARDGAEANDDVIVAEIRRLAGTVKCVALMAVDKGFGSVLTELMDGGQQVLVLASFARTEKWSYEKLGIRVIELPRVEAGKTGSKVRAILHEDGNGSVRLADAFEARDTREEVEFIRCFLQSTGYPADTGYLLPAVVNFWFTNEVGPLTVYPRQSSTLALYELLQNNANRSWERCKSDLAFFLPISATGSRTAAVQNKYGNGHAQECFRGGGPFVRRDSKELVAQALKKMGYIDSRLNQDLAEAMFVFVNVTRNKTTLRKMGMLPCETDTARQAGDKLRTAFLSTCSSGVWQTAPKDGMVRQILSKNGLLTDASCPDVTMAKAMATYLRNQGLPEMKNFNGRVWQILRHSIQAKDPSHVTVRGTGLSIRDKVRLVGPEDSCSLQSPLVTATTEDFIQAMEANDTFARFSLGSIREFDPPDALALRLCYCADFNADTQNDSCSSPDDFTHAAGVVNVANCPAPPSADVFTPPVEDVYGEPGNPLVRLYLLPGWTCLDVESRTSEDLDRLQEQLPLGPGYGIEDKGGATYMQDMVISSRYRQCEPGISAQTGRLENLNFSRVDLAVVGGQPSASSAGLPIEAGFYVQGVSSVEDSTGNENQCATWQVQVLAYACGWDATLVLGISFNLQDSATQQAGSTSWGDLARVECTQHADLQGMAPCQLETQMVYCGVEAAAYTPRALGKTNRTIVGRESASLTGNASARMAFDVLVASATTAQSGDWCPPPWAILCGER
ncbi:unnamed protein product [Symbiodinium sp. CCMP2592]|nr:unnamed protein product [Symbiodinium sp. CCMP2592]